MVSLIGGGKMQEVKRNKFGIKGRQIYGAEDRSCDYRDYRRSIAIGGDRHSTAYTSDIDQIEYIIIDDEVYPVALLELTRYDFDEKTRHIQRWNAYKKAIVNRYFSRDAQGKFITKISSLMDIPAFIVLYRNDLESFWLFNLNNPDGGWSHKNKSGYEIWLSELKKYTIRKVRNE